ncbi:DNA-binding protein [Lactiplantibacillus garii]|uniref:DNA-binding protein n=1 Tax=Lactiplantibacillus garii TaxID=2306423 RepID=A0A3R8L208_9LACO|nr:HIRAN domain-containing protein [Lactiplantibacillus garii]RRK10927.1 DNA-binding protein [Lactiplantibacillus garii]
MKSLEVGMHVTTDAQRTYRILAVINRGRRVLVQAESGHADVQMMNVSEIVQITDQDITTPDVQLATVTVVGEHYVADVATTLASLHVGIPVLLQREPDNEHDDNAISVWTREHAQVGYVARYQNQAYAELMDQGKLLYGVVTQLDREQQRVELMLRRVTEHPSSFDALQVRQRVATNRGALATMPANLVRSPLGDVVITCDGRPLPYQTVPLTPWLTPADELTVTHRYLLTPDWSRVNENSVVTCQTTGSGQVIQRWQSPQENALVLTNADSFYVVGMSAVTMTGRNDNLAGDATDPTAFYRVSDVAEHVRLGFVVSWTPFGDPRAQPALQAALTFPDQPVVPYLPVPANQNHATFTQQELAALLVSGLPNSQGDRVLEPSVSDLTVEKIRVTLGDQAYHALAGYQRRVQLLPGCLENVNTTLVQALIHAVIYHEIATMHYFVPTVGMVTQPIYPLQLFSTTAKDDEQRLVGCLAFYNYDTFDMQQVPLSAIANLAVIADPEHPQTTPAPPNPDWRQIFLHSWNSQDGD